MTPAISAARPAPAGAGLLEKIGFAALAGFVYLFISRLLDVSGSLSRLHIPFVLATLAGAAALLTGRVVAGIANRIVFCYAVLTAIFIAGLPFAFWRGGSFQMLRGSWLHSMLAVLLVTSLAVTYRDCKALLNVIALASFSAAVLGLLQGADTVEGRLALVGGRFSNPNDFALVLLIGLPFIWRIYDGGGQPGPIRRLAALAAGAVTAIGLLKTGSRTGIYALSFAAILILLRVPLITKIRVMALGVAAIVLALLLMPAHLRSRYLTFATADQDAAVSQTERTAVGFAASSARDRQILLRESLMVTLHHPVFGIGLGNFAAYVAQAGGGPDILLSNAWVGTHNTYTQISSEAGIPALIVFIVILVSSWRSLTRTIRSTRGDPRPLARDIHRTAHAMQICLGTFACSMMFFHFAYDMLPHLLVVLTLVLSRTSEVALAELGPAPAVAAIGFAPIRTRPATSLDRRQPTAVQARSARGIPGR